jgi:uncharacterized membrane protein (UPF0127 family)
MKNAERVVMVLLLLVIVGGAGWLYFAIKHDQNEIKDAVARGEYEIREGEEVGDVNTDWETIYPYTMQVFIGSTSVQASIADDPKERIAGLSNTPFLPNHVVKLFVFDAYGEHSIWMKDMNYAIDILWATKEGEIVFIEENVSPDSFPETFASPKPAWYVVETAAGFVDSEKILIGDYIRVP